jgi:hypothetical protein
LVGGGGSPAAEPIVAANTMPAKMLATALRLEIFFISCVLLSGADSGPLPDGEGNRGPRHQDD